MTIDQFTEGYVARLQAIVSKKLGTHCSFRRWDQPGGEGYPEVPVFDIPEPQRAEAQALGITFDDD